MNAARAATQGAGAAAQGNTRPTAKAAHTPQEDSAGGGAAQGEQAFERGQGGGLSMPLPRREHLDG